ncbi:hypothetical protein Ancab_003168 [Ancistrocladus abbreviatus]
MDRVAIEKNIFIPSTLPRRSTSAAPKSVSKHPYPSPAQLRFRRLRVAATSSTSSDGPRSQHLNSLPVTAASPYEVLGISTAATNQEIKAAYRRLARIFHPDVVKGGKEPPAADEFMRIHAAYSTLSDPDKRAEYDGNAFRRLRPLGSFPGISASATSSFCKYRRRNWETDQCW